jgi:hypothetical protein
MRYAFDWTFFFFFQKEKNVEIGRVGRQVCIKKMTKKGLIFFFIFKASMISEDFEYESKNWIWLKQVFWLLVFSLFIRTAIFLKKYKTSNNTDIYYFSYLSF